MLTTKTHRFAPGPSGMAFSSQLAPILCSVTSTCPWPGGHLEKIFCDSCCPTHFPVQQVEGDLKLLCRCYRTASPPFRWHQMTISTKLNQKLFLREWHKLSVPRGFPRKWVHAGAYGPQVPCQAPKSTPGLHLSVQVCHDACCSM